ncbi:MAG: 50S ribosomal protein L17 [Bacteroidales bacterium]|nr:50S ribosomal protein L17 [Bacteroidales bacterium]
MRHRRKFNHLSRKSAHRKAMLANMATSLILHKRIHTTVAKAKALRTYVEPLITKSKEDTTNSRRVVFSYLQSKEAVTELFREISAKVADRPGGYTRIIKLPNRLGDNAEMCMMELVDFNENLLAEKEAKPKTGRRRRSSAKKKADDQVPAETAAVKEAEVDAEVKTEEVAEEVVEEAKAEETAEAKVEEAKPEEEVKVEAKDDYVKEEKKTEEPVAEAKVEAKSEEVKAEEPAKDNKEEVKDKDAPEEKEEEKPVKEEKKDNTK